MRGSIGERNSDAALRFAAKKKVQLQRANALKLERDQASSGTGVSDRMRAFTATNTIGGGHQDSHFSTGGFDVETHSYGTSTERIVIRPSKLLCGDHDKFDTNYSAPPASKPSGLKSDTKFSKSVTAASYRRPPSSEGVSDGGSVDVSGDDGIRCSEQRTNHVHNANSDVFLAPPTDPTGIQVDLSDRPLLCMSTDGRDEVVVGGADHALYAIQVSSLYDNRGRPTRPKKMYGPRHGHSDWITSVAHLAGNRLLLFCSSTYSLLQHLSTCLFNIGSCTLTFHYQC
jgi:hypothetical protein